VTSVPSFVDFFRASAPYIHAHRGRTFVVCFGGEAIASRRFATLIHDIALMSALGIRLAVVHGARPQIEKRVKEAGIAPQFVGGVRVTDGASLECVKEAVGTVRLEIEGLLSMGVPNSPMGGARIRVASGNFVGAQPLGVVDGVDTQHTGIVRKVDAEAIRQRLDSGAIVLIPTIGYSVTGEVFNLALHDVGASVAAAVAADKLVSLVEGRALVDARKRLPPEMTPAEAREIARKNKKRLGDDARRHLEAAVRACEGGVRRAHLVSRAHDGGLLLELFTRDGVGTMVTAESYDGVRAARIEDVGGILELLEPLAADDVLIDRPRDLLERDIDRFTVVERDGLIAACAATYPFPQHRAAEIASVAVHPAYRDAGRGELLLSYLERRAREQGLERLFVLTTRTAHWFRERGFEPGRLADLPPARRTAYDKRRASKILIKPVA
jgi:amino-acid N-acetyltransferase